MAPPYCGPSVPLLQRHPDARVRADAWLQEADRILVPTVEQVVYAGNTFTDSELKTLPFEDVLMRLNRKNGDIDFDNPRKLAGLNYAVQPGESVPFFAVFPSKGRILGLKYSIEIEDFEKTSLE